MDVLRGNFIRRFGRAPEAITRAPGRIEFIGNHTDYNGGVVLGAAIDRAVWVAVAARPDGRRRFATSRQDGTAERDAADHGRAAGAESWINYPVGVLATLARRGLKTPAGFDYLAESDVPLGAGLSSSAAIELSSALAFGALTGQQFEREALVRIGRQAENEFVGVPCGILDQGVSGFGRAGHLVFIDCRGPRFETVPLPAGAHFWIFNTHSKHALVDGLYAARHAECMEAAKALGVPLLADASEARLAERAAELADRQFKRAKHVIEEIGRVGACVRALRAGDLRAAGRLLTQSHRSSQAWFENSTAELDFLVDILTALPGVYGARLTGGGFGGAVMAFTDSSFGQEQANEAAKAYRGKFGAAVDILHAQTADGAERIS